MQGLGPGIDEKGMNRFDPKESTYMGGLERLWQLQLASSHAVAGENGGLHTQ
jgi:hypothetical protein